MLGSQLDYDKTGDNSKVGTHHTLETAPQTKMSVSFSLSFHVDVCVWFWLSICPHQWVLFLLKILFHFFLTVEEKYFLKRRNDIFSGAVTRKNVFISICTADIIVVKEMGLFLMSTVSSFSWNTIFHWWLNGCRRRTAEKLWWKDKVIFFL